MSGADAGRDWLVAAQSVRGASHEQTGAPNQDAVGTTRLQSAQGVVLAVADGHGDPRHARSDRGSRFAIQAGVNALSAWMASTAALSDQELRSSARDLPARIVRDWQSQVRSDLDACPAPEADQSEDDAASLYGSTLVLAATSPRFDIFLQIGDGDILDVAADGSVIRRAPGRTDLPSHFTESICQADAVWRFRTELVLHEGQRDRTLVTLSSDGYANSFIDEASFLKVGPDLKGILEGRGIDYVSNELARWLSETSREGSGDDISLALAWRRPGQTAPASSRHRRRALPIVAMAVVIAVLIPLAVSAGWPNLWSRLVPAGWTHIGKEAATKTGAATRDGKQEPDKKGLDPATLPPIPY